MQTLLRHADYAMDQTKARGRHQYSVFDDTMHAQVTDRLAQEEELQSVEHGRFVLHYQPVVEARTGRVTSVEAPVRMRAADGGRVAPAGFVRMAEDMGLAVPLGDRVLSAACRRLAAWGADGPPGRQRQRVRPPVRQPGFADGVLDTLR